MTVQKKNTGPNDGSQMAGAVRRAYEEFGDETYTFSVVLLACLISTQATEAEREEVIADHARNVRAVIEANCVAGRA